MANIKLEYIDVFDENKTKTLEFSRHLINSSFNEKSLFTSIVDGKSMEPLIFDKALVISDLSQKKLSDGEIYLVNYQDKMWIKKYDEKTEVFYSLNKDFAHLKYELKKVKIIAKVLLTFTNL